MVEQQGENLQASVSWLQQVQDSFPLLNLAREVSCSCEKTVWPLSAHKMQHTEEGDLVLPEGKGDKGLRSVWEHVGRLASLPNPP